jgi:dihydroflavonol-4-reductase
MAAPEWLGRSGRGVALPGYPPPRPGSIGRPVNTLVTGATGFIGSAVARVLIARGHEVRALVRRGSDRRNLDGLPLEVVEGDLRDPGSLRQAMHGCKAVFHVAADYRLWMPDPSSLYETNVAGTEALLRAAEAEGVERFVHTSSVGALGIDPSGEPADEDTPVRISDVIGHYHRSKFLAEDMARRFAERLPVVIVNPSFPVGPRDIKPTATGRTILNAAAGRMPAYLDTGVNLVHVDDVAEGHYLAFEKGRVGRNYILGGRNLTLRELLVLIGRICGREPRPVRLPYFAGIAMAQVFEGWARLTGRPPLATHDEVRLARRHMYFSSARAERELGYHPRPAEEAVRDSLAWFAANGYLRGSRYQPQFLKRA